PPTPARGRGRHAHAPLRPVRARGGPPSQPQPRPGRRAFVDGHVFVTRAALTNHPAWGPTALPLGSQLHVRQKDVPSIPKQHGWTFGTKLQLAAEQLEWLKVAAGERFASIG